jgi:general secretion pathway protein C
MSSFLRHVLTLTTWALVAGSAVYWTLAVLEPAPQWPPVSVSEPTQVRAQTISNWLAAPQAARAPEPVASTRFKLLGLIAQGRRGVALLAVDGQPAQPFLVGSTVAEGVVLRSVGPHFAELSAGLRGPVLHRLELPPLAQQEPATGLVVGARPAASR